MRVAFLAFEAFYQGGIRTYAREILNGLASRGHDVALFAPPPPKSVEPGLDARVRVRIVPHVDAPLLAAPTFWAGVPRAVRAEERSRGAFDVVHSNTLADVFLGPRATRAARVVTAHHLGRSIAATAPVRKRWPWRDLTSDHGPAVWGEARCLRRADRVIAVSRYTAAEIRRHYPDVPVARVSVVYNGVRPHSAPADAQAVADLRAKWDLHPGEHVLLCAGRLEPRKGIDFLLKGMAVASARRTAKLVLFGEGDPSPYRALARRWSIDDRVVFAGLIPDAEVRAAYALANAYAQPSVAEGFGLAVADALAQGLPVVATRAGAIPELLRDGEDGELVAYGDVPALAEAIDRALHRPRHADPAQARAALMARFDPKRAVDDTIAAYERAVQSRAEGDARAQHGPGVRARGEATGGA